MAYTRAMDAPARRQFEAPHLGYCGDGTDWRAWNCGPTCAAFVDGFYHDRRLAIDPVRRLATGECVATTAADVATMLNRLGIPSSQHYGTDIGLITSVVANRARPMVVAVNMAKIPLNYLHDSFRGYHWLVVAANSSLSGRPAKLVMDPNATAGQEWTLIPDTILSGALIGDSVIPASPKKIAVNPTGTNLTASVGPGRVTGFKIDRYTHVPVGSKSSYFSRASYAGKCASSLAGFYLCSEGYFAGYYLITGRSGPFVIRQG